MDVLLLRDLAARGIPYSASYLRKLIAGNRFPKPFRLIDGGRLAWSESQIDAYLTERMAAAEVQPSPPCGRRTLP
jgi:predicted DNA-binding transcriptional regulator AlpA